MLAPDVCFHILVKVTEWPPIGKISAHSVYDMFHGIKYLIVSLVFSHLGFWSGNLFLIAPLYKENIQFVKRTDFSQQVATQLNICHSGFDILRNEKFIIG